MDGLQAVERGLLLDEPLDAALVQVLKSSQGQVLSLRLAQLNLFSCYQVKVQGRIGAGRRADSDLRQADLLYRLRVHGGDNRIGRPGLESVLNHVDVVAEAGDHNHCPDASDEGIFAGGDVGEAMDCGRLEEVSASLDHLICLDQAFGCLHQG